MVQSSMQHRDKAGLRGNVGGRSSESQQSSGRGQGDIDRAIARANGYRADCQRCIEPIAAVAGIAIRCYHSCLQTRQQ